MGLLDSLTSDPQSLATMQLAAGLLSPGSFGQGLGRGVSGFQGALINAQDMAAKKQAMDLQNLQMQQQKRMFDLQTPFLQEAVRRLQGQQSQPSDMSAASDALSAGAQQGSVGPTVANAQRMSPAQQGGSLFPGVPDNVAFGMIGAGGFSKLPDTISKFAEPTPEMKNLAAAYGPNSQQYQDALRAVAQKAGYIAPVNARPGAILRNPVTMQPMAFNPHVPEGGTPVFDASGNVTAINPISNATNIMQAAEAAKAAGKAQFTPYAGYDATGRPAPVSSVADVLTPRADQAAGAAFQAKDPAGMRAQIAKIKDPGERDAMLAAFDRQFPEAKSGVFATPPLGAATAADFQQTDLGKRYSSLRDQASQAQTTTSYLQNIKQLATTAATGQFSDKQKFVNSLLDLVGVSEKATDSVTANNLLDKYSNQIVARLGQGGLGTDSARAILQSAYPNAHMTPKAINEAADNLIGANEMVKSKMALLSPHGNAKDPVAYQQKEQQFDMNADPRLWQLKAMNPDQAKNFLFSMPPAVRADLAKRAQVLKGMGAL